MMKDLFDPLGIDMLISSAKHLGGKYNRILTRDMDSQSLNTIKCNISEQDAMYGDIIARAKVAFDMLEVQIKSIDSILSTGVEDATNARGVIQTGAEREYESSIAGAELEYQSTIAEAQRVKDCAISKAKREHDDECKRADDQFKSFEDKANTDAEDVKKKQAAAMEEAENEAKRANQDQTTNLLTVKVLVKCVEFGHHMLSYFTDDNAEAQRKGTLLLKRLQKQMQPAIDKEDHNALLTIAKWSLQDALVDDDSLDA